MFQVPSIHAVRIFSELEGLSLPLMLTPDSIAASIFLVAEMLKGHEARWRDRAFPLKEHFLGNSLVSLEAFLPLELNVCLKLL